MNTLLSLSDYRLLATYHVTIQVDTSNHCGFILFQNRRLKISAFKRSNKSKDWSKLNLEENQIQETASKIAIILLKKELLQKSLSPSLNVTINKMGLTYFHDRKFIQHIDSVENKNTQPDYEALENYLTSSRGVLTQKNLNDAQNLDSYRPDDDESSFVTPSKTLFQQEDNIEKERNLTLSNSQDSSKPYSSLELPIQHKQELTTSFKEESDNKEYEEFFKSNPSPLIDENGSNDELEMNRRDLLVLAQRLNEEEKELRKQQQILQSEKENLTNQILNFQEVIKALQNDKDAQILINQSLTQELTLLKQDLSELDSTQPPIVRKTNDSHQEETSIEPSEDNDKIKQLKNKIQRLKQEIQRYHDLENVMTNYEILYEDHHKLREREKELMSIIQKKSEDAKKQNESIQVIEEENRILFYQIESLKQQLFSLDSEGELSKMQDLLQKKEEYIQQLREALQIASKYLNRIPSPN